MFSRQIVHDPYLWPDGLRGYTLACIELGDRVAAGMTFESSLSESWALDQIRNRAEYRATL